MKKIIPLILMAFSITAYAKDTAPYANYMTQGYLTNTLAMIQGDSSKRLNDNYRACVLKPYPAMQIAFDKFLKAQFDEKMLSLLNENYLLDKEMTDNKHLTDKQKQAYLDKIKENENYLFSNGFAEKLKMMGGMLFDENFAKQQNQTAVFNELHRLTNLRLAECQK